MSDKKIVVPEGMLEAVVAVSPQADRPSREFAREFYRPLLEAALEWLSEHPIVPIDKEVEEILDKVEPYRNWPEMVKRVVEIWQRQMFIAPGSHPNDNKINKELADLLRPEMGIVEAMN